ncbi:MULTISPECIES: DivIVA domain-containing protein [Aurantimicrobium]|uniref:Cell wall synthesis protein Wag31 n=1 Tax=Aurantimicrobium photophilum TaxID=1987356 RepID=A0A2Z3S6B9_9MICO|nr:MULTISPECIES: DivIVA domain-containing protein [Aurantimicrobium]AWR21692.1 hypothetical protein AURMO_01098 [Aurantimicrobium photophilum]MDH6255661.1 cell division septum initiation protein DivIVA [Aurantimicrobium minutum]MDH6536340.1 cell division septum initiation protein DivIVA [Aurantimicrobium minutum]
MATEESFSRVLRGYDPAEVDPLIQKLRRELLTANTLRDETSLALKQSEARIAELELEVGLRGTPTVQGLSTSLNNKLKKADKLAAGIVKRAESDALFIRSAAEKTSSQFIEAARDDYERARTEAQALSASMAEQARELSENIIAAARTEAAAIVASGQEEAQRLRGEAATVAANLRAETRNEIARMTAEAHREAEELKLILVTNRDPNISVDEEIVSLLKLNADGAAVRAEMEQELQTRHQESLMQTDKYIGAAEAQLATARTRQRTLEAELDALENASKLQSEQILEQARLQAAKHVEHADKLARKKISDAEKYVAAVIASIYSHIEGIRAERESVAAFFDALRLELQNSLGDAVTTKKLDR